MDNVASMRQGTEGVALKHHSRNTEEGFTLVELAIVIVIIGIIMAIAIPIYSNQQKKAMEAQVRSDVTATASSLKQWQQSNGYDRIPTGRGYPNAGGLLIPNTLETAKIVIDSDTTLPLAGDGPHIQIKVFNAGNPDLIEFCIEGYKKYSTNDKFTYSYSSKSRTGYESPCVATDPDTMSTEHYN